MSGGSKLPRRARRRGPFLNDLPRRAFLTIKHHGWRELLARIVDRAAAAVRRGAPGAGSPRAVGRAAEGRQVVPRDRPARHDRHAHLRRSVHHDRRGQTAAAHRRPVAHTNSWSSTTEARNRTRRSCSRSKAPRSSSPRPTAGYAASVNRGLARADRDHDVVVLNNDVIGHRRWLETLQQAAYEEDDTGVVGPMLLYPDGRIQAAGAHRNLGAPEWFDHRYRFKRPDHGPAGVPDDALAVTGAAMYLRRSLIDELGRIRRRASRWRYEDVDYCLRAWEAGCQVRYEPASRLTHVESPTRGTEVGERELRSQEHFWDKWGDWFDRRDVRNRRRRPADHLRDAGHRRRRRPPRRVRAPQPPAAARPLGGALLARRDRPTGSRSRCPFATFEQLRGPGRGPRARGRDQGRHLVGDRALGLARLGHARHPGLLRPGHRDLVLPGRPGGPEPRPRQLPRGVPLHDDLGLEPSAAGRAGPRGRADPAGDRPGQLPSSRPSQARRRGAGRSAARCRSRTSRSRSTPGSGSSRGPSCGCSEWSPSSAPSTARATSSAPATSG